MCTFRLCTGFSLLLALVALAAAPRACAQDRAPLYLRTALGAGYAGIGSDRADDATNNVGYALAWDAALGAFVHRSVAVHASLFGHYAPHSLTKYDESPRERGSMWAQHVGAGFTVAPPLGFRRAPSLRPFLSSSLGLAIVDDHMKSSGSIGAAWQLLGGFELKLSARLRIGLALQGAYAWRPDAGGRPFHAGHGAALLTFSYDRRTPVPGQLHSQGRLHSARTALTPSRR